MKNVIISAILMFIITSCSSTLKFPVSSVTPAAVITAKVKQDKSNNYKIIVTAKNLASADRLSPPKKTYVVWIATSSSGVKNIGQLKGKKDKKATLETLTSFDPLELIITAEGEGDVSYPTGIEISRTTVKK